MLGRNKSTYWVMEHLVEHVPHWKHVLREAPPSMFMILYLNLESTLYRILHHRLFKISLGDIASVGQ